MSQAARTLPAGDVATPLQQPHNFTFSFLHPLISSPSHGHCFITALSRCLELSLPGEEGGWLFLLRLITGRLLIDRLVPLCSPAVVVKAE